MPPVIGIFGGTFDPPHLGHQALAGQALARFSLDRLLWVLTPDPPHKQDQAITLLKHRLAMVKLAIAGNPAFELSRIEIDRSGPHYALDTVTLLAQKYPAAELIYLMGGDSLHDLPTWHRPFDLLSACRYIGVLRRPSDSVDLSVLEQSIPGLQDKIRFMDVPPMNISSSEIRQRAARGGGFKQDLLPAVYDYIVKHHLYR